MTDNELKLLVIVVGVISAIFGAFTSVAVFLWREGRQNYLKETAGLRAIVLMAESIYASLKCGHLKISEVKLDWLTFYVDVILKDKPAYDILCRLLQLRVEALCFDPNGGKTLHVLTVQGEELKRDCVAMLDAHVGKLSRRLFLLGQ